MHKHALEDMDKKIVSLYYIIGEVGKWSDTRNTCFSGYFGADIKETASMWPKSTS